MNVGRPTVCSATKLAYSASCGRLNIFNEVPCIFSKHDATRNATVYPTKNQALDLLALGMIETLKLVGHSTENICFRVTTDDPLGWNRRNAMSWRKNKRSYKLLWPMEVKVSRWIHTRSSRDLNDRKWLTVNFWLTQAQLWYKQSNTSTLSILSSSIEWTGRTHCSHSTLLPQMWSLPPKIIFQTVLKAMWQPKMVDGHGRNPKLKCGR